MRIKILYEDKYILAIDKPSGISVHHDGRSKEKTITDWVLKNYPKLKGVGEPIKISKTSEEAQNFSSCALPRVRGGTLGDKNFELLSRPGIVHRLDKETSGVLIIVKNKKAFAYFNKQFMERRIKKTYVAIVSGWVNPPAGGDHGIVNKPIGRSPSDFRRRLAGRGARGELREAITEYKVLKRFTAPAEHKTESSENFHSCALPRVRGGTLGDVNFQNSPLNKFSYLEIHPKTGRTHQIRVHMKYLNHPIVCDSLYAPNNPCPKNINRLALHAKSIEFENPKGKIIKIESPLPNFLKI